MINSLINFGFIAWANIQGYSTYDLLIEELITFFLYFEFIALIVKYFKNNFHFPLDFFLYIGITAIVRSVIIAHDTAFDILIWAISIFVLVCSLVLVKDILVMMNNIIIYDSIIRKKVLPIFGRTFLNIQRIRKCFCCN